MDTAIRVEHRRGARPRISTREPPPERKDLLARAAHGKFRNAGSGCDGRGILGPWQQPDSTTVGRYVSPGKGPRVGWRPRFRWDVGTRSTRHRHERRDPILASGFEHGPWAVQPQPRGSARWKGPRRGG